MYFKGLRYISQNKELEAKNGELEKCIDILINHDIAGYKEGIDELESKLSHSVQIMDAMTKTSQSNFELERKLKVACEVLSDWLKWEDKQIQKEGAYVGVEIRGLIAQGKEALAAIKDA